MGRTTMTYSILGWDATNGDLGVAVQSKFPGVGSLVPYGEAEVGVVATQGFGNPQHGSAGLMLLKCGARPQQAVDVLLLPHVRSEHVCSVLVVNIQRFSY